jgi:serine/threonine protein kinase
LLDGMDSEFFSDELRDFLKLCLKRQPDKRASVEELLDHMWINKMETERTTQLQLLLKHRKDFAV